jgi:hypothetical protein
MARKPTMPRKVSTTNRSMPGIGFRMDHDDTLRFKMASLTGRRGLRPAAASVARAIRRPRGPSPRR